MIELGVTAILSIALSAVFSGMETGIYGLQRVRLRVRAAAGDEVADRLLVIAGRPELTVVSILLLNNAANYIVAWSTESLIGRLVSGELGDVELSLLATLYVTPVLFIFGELVPKTVFLHRPHDLLGRILPIYLVASWLVRPLASPFVAVLRQLERGPLPEHDLLERPGVRSLLTTSQLGPALTPFQRKLARQVFALRALKARDRMIPWERVARVEADADRERVIEVATRFSRKRLVLVDPDGAARDLYVNALEFALAEEPRERAIDAAHEAFVVAPETPLFEVLSRLQQARRPLAIVRAGRTRQPVGLITATEISQGILGLSAPLRQTQRASRVDRAPPGTPRRSSSLPGRAAGTTISAEGRDSRSKRH